MEKKEFYECPYCGSHIKHGNGHHTKRCREEYVKSLSENDKLRFYRLYVEEQRSLLELSDIVGLPYQQLQRLLPEIGIELRKIKEASKTPRKKELYEKSMMKHFGTKHNFDRNCQSRKDWQQRLFEEEGITNVFQRQEVKDKIKNTMIERYGDNWKYQRSKSNDINYYIEKYGEIEGRKEWNRVCYEKGRAGRIEYYIEKYGEIEGRKEWNRVCYEKGRAGRIEYYIEKYGEVEGIEKWEQRLSVIAKGFSHNNGLNEACANILAKNEITYEREYPIQKPDGNRCYLFDFKIGNLLIELNGIYWHCSPKLYKPNDVVKFPYNHFIIAKDKWEQDKKKCETGRSQGYIVETIWEDEFSEEKLLQIIKKYNYGDYKN